MTKQKQSGIDLSQAASNLGSIEESSQQSKEKKQPKASKVAQPGLTGRDDHLLGELRQQCKLHRTELNSWTAESPMNNIEVFHFVQIRGQ